MTKKQGIYTPTVSADCCFPTGVSRLVCSIFFSICILRLVFSRFTFADLYFPTYFRFFDLFLPMCIGSNFLFRFIFPICIFPIVCSDFFDLSFPIYIFRVVFFRCVFSVSLISDLCFLMCIFRLMIFRIVFPELYFPTCSFWYVFSSLYFPSCFFVVQYFPNWHFRFVFPDLLFYRFVFLTWLFQSIFETATRWKGTPPCWFKCGIVICCGKNICFSDSYFPVFFTNAISRFIFSDVYAPNGFRLILSNLYVRIVFSGMYFRIAFSDL